MEVVGGQADLFLSLGDGFFLGRDFFDEVFAHQIALGVDLMEQAVVGGESGAERPLGGVQRT